MHSENFNWCPDRTINYNLHRLLATVAGWYGDRIPVGSETFCTRPDRRRGPPSVLYSGYRVISGVKEAGAWR
jgi:hypothetical protein